MKTADLLVGTNTLWVLVAAALVIFMQAGFAFVEVGLTRMKNAGHVAVKNIVVLAIAMIVYWAVGFGLAFGDGSSSIIGTSGFFPSASDMLKIGATPFSFFGIPGGAAFMFEVAFAAVSLAIVWGAMAERVKLSTYFIFGVYFIIVYSVTSHWIWDKSGWLFQKGMQDFAGSTVVHYQGALAGLAGAILLGPRKGKFGADGKANALPGHNIPFVVAGVMILWLGWFGFNPGSTLGIQTGDRLGFFAYVALNTNLAAAAGGLAGAAVSFLVFKKVDMSMTMNGVLAALVAITAACAFVDTWAAVIVGIVSGIIAVYGVVLVDRLRIDDPVGSIAVHGMAGVWGTIACGLLATGGLATTTATGTKGLFYGGGFHQLGIQLLGIVAVGAFTFTLSFAGLFVLKHTIGLRVSEEDEASGLDIAEHGMWGYPEMYIPVPGGYGTEPHAAAAHAQTLPTASTRSSTAAIPTGS
jgi:Amt family ammonium transporter